MPSDNMTSSVPVELIWLWRAVVIYLVYRVIRFVADWVYRHIKKPLTLDFWFLFHVLPELHPSVDNIGFRMLQGPVDRVLCKRALTIERAIRKREAIEERYPKPSTHMEKPHFSARKGARPWWDQFSYVWKDLMVDLARARFYYARAVADRASVTTGQSWTDYLDDKSLKSEAGREAAQHSDTRLVFQPNSSLGRQLVRST